jgi:hypothetical protein
MPFLFLCNAYNIHVTLIAHAHHCCLRYYTVTFLLVWTLIAKVRAQAQTLVCVWQGWPEPCIPICGIFGSDITKYAVINGSYTYIYGSGQPYQTQILPPLPQMRHLICDASNHAVNHLIPGKRPGLSVTYQRMKENAQHEIVPFTNSSFLKIDSIELH